METYNTLKTLVTTVGLVSVLEELQNIIKDFESKHGYRRDFCTLSNAVIAAMISCLTTFEKRYGYVAGKEA